jgi:diacylglycerol O-acyltransferase
MFLELPVTASDPTERLALVVRRMAEQKAQGVSTSTDAVVSLADHVPAPLLARAARWYARTGQRRVNVAATNVIGPSEPRSLIGRLLLELAPYVPLAQEVRTAAALVSYAGGLTIGITSDSDAVPDLDHLVDAVRQSLLELVAAYRTGPARGPSHIKITQDPGC